MDSKFSESDILHEIERQDRKRIAITGSDLDQIVQRATEESEEEITVDIIEYIRAEWGLNENPYPIQRFILKVIFGIPLDDRPDDLITEVISPTQFKCFRQDQFRRVKYLDIGENKAVKVRRVNLLQKIVILEEEPEFPLLAGDTLTGRIEVWDKFRENIVGTYNEREFFDFLYGDGPGSETCRISLSREEYERNLGRQMNLVVFRLGRRGTKSSLAQWIAAYFCYRVLKKYHPQEYYQTRRDQPITITLIATTKIQAQDLLAPARATIKRSPYLRRFVDHDDVRRIDLNTPYNIDNGLDSESGIKIKADPCSARATRGPAIMLGLLEEFGLFMSHIKDSNSSDKEIFTAIAPGISDLKNPETDEPEGLMIIVSTPLTTESYMYEVESSIWDGESELSNSLALHIPSPWVNPLLSSKALRSFHAVDSAGYEQEYEARYSDQYRKAFTREVVERCRQEPGSHQWLRPGEDVFMGFDLGGLKAGSDRTTISLIAMNSEGLGRLIFHEVISYGLPGYEDYLDETREELDLLSIKKIAKRIDEVWIRWGVRKGLGDQWNCMPPYTMVTTPVGHKPMGEVEVGDTVLNKDGEWVTVEEKFSRPYCGEIIKIKIEGHPDALELTPEHQVQIWDQERGGWIWEEAGNLSVTDRLRSIPPQETIDMSLTLDQAELVGWYMAEGDIERQNENSQRQVRFSLGYEEVDEADRIEQLLQENFPVSVAWHPYNSGGNILCPTRQKITQTALCVLYTNDAACEFLSKNIPLVEKTGNRKRSSGRKTLASDWILYPKDIQKKMLQAYWLGDGCKTGYVQNINGARTASSASWRLIDQLQLISWRVGSWAWQRHTYCGNTISARDAKKDNLESTQYCQLSHWIGMGGIALENILNRGEEYQSCRSNILYYSDGSYGRRIKKLGRVFYNGDVQDIRVSKGSSFTAETVVVHNCFGVTSHLTSEAHDGLELVNVTAAFNDQVARNFIAYIEQAQLTIFALFEDWKIDDSLIRELCRLDRKETGGIVKKIALMCPKTEGQHDDQYSSVSRALFVAQQEIVKQPPNLSPRRPNMSPTVGVRERAEMARQRNEVLMRTRRGHSMIPRGGRR